MADKTITIKSASDKELDDLIARLRKENEAQNLVATLIRQGSNGYIPYDQPLGVSTEQPIVSLYHTDKSKTIKNSTDQELNDLIIRLRKEVEAQSLVANLNRQSMSTYLPYDQQVGISTEQPIDSMYHIGVLGMHWGHRKAQTPHDPSKNSEDHNKKVSLKGKKLSEMSNAELKAFNERMQLERQYRDLTKADIGPGRKFVSDVLSNSAKQLASQYVSKYAAKGIDAAIKRAIKK